MFEKTISEIKVGKKLSEVYDSSIKYAETLENGHLHKHLSKTLGYGIGLQAKEELLAIKADNSKVIEPGMVFTIRMSLANFDKESRPTRNCL